MELQILLTGLIALCAVLSSLGFIFKLLLSPVKEDIIDLKSGQKTLESGQKALESGQKALESGQKALESGQKALESGQKELHTKLDKLLNQSFTT